MKLHSSSLVLLSMSVLAPSANSFGSQSFNARLQKAGLSRPVDTSTRLNSITNEQIGVLDGSSYNALDLFVQVEGRSSSKSHSKGEQFGVIKVVTGTLDQNPTDRIIGIVAEEVENPNEHTSTIPIQNKNGGIVYLYKDSIAKIPKSVSDQDAMSTCIAALSGVHCACFDPDREADKVVKGIGGSADDFVLPKESVNGKGIGKKVVVLGGSDYASFISAAAAALGGDVTQITTNKLIRPRKQANVSVSPPAIGELELGFSSVLGNFDAMVDTLSDEARVGDAACRGFDEGSNSGSCSSAVISLLQKQHKCKRYISTLTISQKKVQDDGIIWGRSKADGYGKDVIKKVQSKAVSSVPVLVPPKKYGSKTLQRLLDAGIVYKNKQKDVYLQGWSMQDFLELVSWPREAEGGNIRFGLPVVADIDTLADEEEEEGRMISAPPLAAGAVIPKGPEDRPEVRRNPYIMDINGLPELNSEIVESKKDCLLFLSASYCRTCKYLAPQYLRLAKQHKQAGDDVVFAKLNAVGKVGKEVKKTLDVDAVPAFMFFKAGERYGTVLSITKMPSKKLDAALDLLLSGDQWDGNMIRALK